MRLPRGQAHYVNGAGNATVATDAKGNTTTTTYDADNQAIETKVAGSGATVQDTLTTYDAIGNKVSSQVIDNANNPTTTYTYDSSDKLTQQTDPTGKVTTTPMTPRAT